ncbi:hypothetical protein PAXRUDRAFT_821352 [Paxillus rubicundulus Ve08.2h10]|uniref:Uncharacterized protein n=1 Tax=Paxillus rubicundulus Ve08.2h10 TaxID=930991 RepID=A0A0D0DYD8_9AGAM|nr:hypothetical protein PAXRUDRAFT_821352 [Paxillus rubicundulus Ve08.2h10]
MSSNRISVLLNWCTDNGIRIDPRIQVIESSDIDHHSDDSDRATDNASSKCGLAVYSCEELTDCPCTLVYIPKTAVLSVKSCSPSQGISSIPHGHGAPLSLSLALYCELLRGPKSRWFGYLQSLPREIVDIAMFWGADDVINTGPCTCPSRGCSNIDRDIVRGDTYHTPDAQCSACAQLHDGQNAKAWLEVTEAYREQVGLVVSYSPFHPLLSSASHWHVLGFFHFIF